VKRLVVIPSDPLQAYVEKGRAELLQEYYNPKGYFDEVYVLSPIESVNAYRYGMFISKETLHSFKRKLRLISPDLIRVYGGYWPSDFIAKVRPRDIPVIISIHDSHAAMIHESIVFADYLICMSEAAEKAILEKTNVDKKKLLRLPNRVDTNIFNPGLRGKEMHELLPSCPKGKAILHVGRKSVQKNLDTLISALRLLPKEYYCVFVGQGDKAHYIERANNEGVSDRCYWVGSVNNSDLVDWYRACSCLCVPSLWEGFGIVFIEAAACGTPIITSNIQPMNEYLKHKESAYLVDDYNSPAAIAHAVLSVCNDTNLRDEMSSKAVLVASKFDKEKIDQMERDIYASLLRTSNFSDMEWIKLKIWRAEAWLKSILRVVILRPIRSITYCALLFKRNFYKVRR